MTNQSPQPALPAGILLACEGIDGAGKTTQVRRLATALAAAGESVLVSKEPTDGRWGRKLKSSAERGRLGFVGELLAFVKDRREHVRQTIEPALERGKIVLLDRYFYSTIAYQGARLADGSPEALERLERLVSRGIPRPAMVFVLDVPARSGVRRISEGRGESPNEFEGTEALERSRRIFHDLCRREPDRLWEIDGTAEVEAVHRTILSLLVWGALWKRRCGVPHGCDDPADCPRRDRGCAWQTLRRKLLPPDGEPDYTALLSAAPVTPATPSAL